MSARGWWLVPLLGLVACAEHGSEASPQLGGPARAPAAEPAPAEPAEAIRPAATTADCAARIADAERAPALAGAPGFDARRAEILGRAKAEPVLFRRPPVPDPNVSLEIQSFRQRIARSPSPGFTLMGLYKTIVRRPDVVRQLLLSEGYLYSESPGLAAALVDLVELHHLFDAPELVIERGSQRLTAKKRPGFWYEYQDGPERGQRARVLLLDRIWAAGSEPGPALHLDLRTAAVEAGIERMRVRRLTEQHIVADVRHGHDWVPALFDLRGTDVVLACEVVPQGREEAVSRARDLALRRRAVLSQLQLAMVTMVNEALPFDEPRTEEGQQDGNLRPAWRWAYTHGWDSYTFNEDTYLVFDTRGRPKVPQVCIDFITDTFERASGTWWADNRADRARSRGGVDFDEIGIINRRSVDVFIQFAEEHPEWFDVYGLAETERVRFLDRQPFFQHLIDHSDRYAPGDVVAIHGPRDDGENHWHSFFVYDTDPMSGMPILLASNAGKPRVRSWEGEMRNAPLRSIRTRIRPRLDWLERVLPAKSGATAVAPAPLISAPI